MTHAFFIVLNKAYLNAHSVRKRKLFKYNEVDQTPSLKVYVPYNQSCLIWKTFAIAASYITGS
jgi:hypothetical protein